MGLTTEQLSRHLLTIAAEVRTDSRGVASFVCDSAAAEAVTAILQGHSDLLGRALAGRLAKYVGTARRVLAHQTSQERLDDLITFAFMYAIEPPAVKDVEQSVRRGRLRLQDWLDWLRSDRDPAEFKRGFSTWAAVCVTEYFRRANRAGIDGTGPEWAPVQARAASSEITADEVAAPLVLAEDWEEASGSELPAYKQVDNVIAGLLRRLNGEKEKQQVITAMVFLRCALQFEYHPQYKELAERALEVCTRCNGGHIYQTRTRWETLLEQQRTRRDLAKRRKAGDLPPITYDDLLDLFGVDSTSTTNYYVAFHRFLKTLEKEVRSPERARATNIAMTGEKA